METIPYRNPALSIGERVKDLLARMTIPEKVGQLMQLNGFLGFEEAIETYGVGSLFHVNGARADQAIELASRTRLGIPLLLADDAIHGHSFWAGATIFPTQLALASSWDPDLLVEVGRVTAREMRVTGLKWTFAPVLCIARDLRWGRVDETFGEDPFLIGSLATALIQGLQGRGLDDPEAVLATAKHYAGYSETLGGRDASEADLSRRKLCSYFLPPFEAAARSGCMAFMTGYQSIDGQPSTMNRWLLTEKLREEWGFEGIVVTDYNNVGSLVEDQQVCADYAEASALALKAGNDLIMQTPKFFEGCQEALRRGLLSEAQLDRTLSRVLGLKFRMGLFENPGLSDPSGISRVIGCREHREVNLRAARESLVLLKNGAASADDPGAGPLLPLDPAKPARLAIVGPNADDPLAQLGDWSLGSGQMTSPSGDSHPRQAIVTIRDGLVQSLPSGWTLGSPEEADVIVLVLGDNLRYVGEGKSTATLELQDGQIEEADRMARLGKKLVVVLVNSKPLVLPRSILEAQAIFELFNPGMMGGQALAEALFGKINPEGKLAVSIPLHAGQQPVYYNQVRGQHGDRYADLSQDPAFPFGFGLSYTRFEYRNPRLEAVRLGRGDRLRLSVEVRNTGSRAGVEIVQLYVEDLVTSLTWAVRELLAFKRVPLQAGESKTLSFEVPVSELWICDAQGKRVVEKGGFRALVGSSSRLEDLKALEFSVE